MSDIQAAPLLTITEKPTGEPLDTVLTKEAIKWYCFGAVDPKRVIPLGIPEEFLIALWNTREKQRECGE